MKTLIIGRTASGKSTLGKIMEKAGLKGVKSYTTRPQRNENDNDHIFISKDDVDKYPDKIAQTIINSHNYFATKEQLSEANFYIIDPKGFYEVIENCPDMNFAVVYIQADEDLRRKHYELRGSTDFDERNASESKQFDEFEKMLKDKNKKLPNNIINLVNIDNNFDLYFDMYSVFFHLTTYAGLANSIRNQIRDLIDNYYVKIIEKNNQEFIKFQCQENGKLGELEYNFEQLAWQMAIDTDLADMVFDNLITAKEIQNELEKIDLTTDNILDAFKNDVDDKNNLLN